MIYTVLCFDNGASSYNLHDTKHLFVKAYKCVHSLSGTCAPMPHIFHSRQRSDARLIYGLSGVVSTAGSRRKPWSRKTTEKCCDASTHWRRMYRAPAGCPFTPTPDLCPATRAHPSCPQGLKIPGFSGPALPVHTKAAHLKGASLRHRMYTLLPVGRTA
ncbi:hypothetical protein MRX96_010027 [Rhipicephalus microplus]